jgi:hypothetical protein
MATRWSHLVYVDREKVGRDWHNTLKGFASKEEAEEYGRYYDENWYVYFPKVLRIWEDNGQVYLTMRVADSCD